MTDTVDYSGKTVVAKDYYMAYDKDDPSGPSFGPILPAGTILPWSGDESSIPDGWVICDGTSKLTDGNASPDLRGKFIKGITSSDGATSGTGSDGASFSGTLTTSQDGKHPHQFPSGLSNVSTSTASSGHIIIKNTGSSAGSQSTASAGKHSHTLPFSATATVTNDSKTPASLDGKVVPNWISLYFIIKLDRSAG